MPVFNRYGYKIDIGFCPRLAGKKFENRRVAGWEKIKEYNRQGHEISSHSLTHKMLGKNVIFIAKRLAVSFLNTPNKAYYLKRVLENLVARSSPDNIIHLDDDREISESKKIIEKETRAPKIAFIYPYGFFDSLIKEKVKSCGYAAARGLTTGINRRQNVDFFDLKTFLWENKTTAAQANWFVKDAIKKKGWLIECLHRINEDGECNYPFSSKWDELLSHLEFVKKSKITVDTMTHVWQ